MAVDVHLFASGVPRRMGPAAFTLASTVEQATGGWNHRVTAVYGTEAVPAPPPGTTVRIPPGPVPAGHSVNDSGVMYPTWSVVAPAFPFQRTVRPVGGGYFKPNEARITTALASLPQDLVVTPKMVVRTGAAQGRVTTSPKAQMRWVRQGG